MNGTSRRAPGLHPGAAVAEHASRPRGFAWIEVAADERSLPEWLGDHELPLKIGPGPPVLTAVAISTDAGEIVLPKRGGQGAVSSSNRRDMTAESCGLRLEQPDRHWACRPSNGALGPEYPIEYPMTVDRETVRKAEDPARMPGFRVARPGLEPGTPRFSGSRRRAIRGHRTPAN